jgi:hypothetical protein
VPVAEGNRDVRTGGTRRHRAKINRQKVRIKQPLPGDVVALRFLGTVLTKPKSRELYNTTVVMNRHARSAIDAVDDKVIHETFLRLHTRVHYPHIRAANGIG